MGKKLEKKSSTMVTAFASFYRAVNGGETRYYPNTPTSRLLAIDYMGGSLPPVVGGFGVYDTTISSDYAVALYTDVNDANAHAGAPAPNLPTSIFEEEPTADDVEDFLDDALDEDEEVEDGEFEEFEIDDADDDK